MAYGLQITGQNGFISFADWREAVSAFSELRFDSDDIVAINPRTGQKVSVPGREGNVAFFFETLKQWLVVFSWDEGRVFFKYAPADSEVMEIAFRLAEKLHGKIVGENGEPSTP